ncbi:hypothetical protein D6779_03350 [Candidatus Parcubacteria bacterium]|nr:MAG: hypothetical protein D6779_03350 [Candidatus Parcubacteria bacterium]
MPTGRVFKSAVPGGGFGYMGYVRYCVDGIVHVYEARDPLGVLMKRKVTRCDGRSCEDALVEAEVGYESLGDLLELLEEGSSE